MEHGPQAVHGARAQGRWPLQRAHELPNLGVPRVEEREAHEAARGGQVDDHRRVVLVRLPGLPGDDVAPAPDVAREDAHHLVAQLVEVVGEREPAVAGELDPDQDLAGVRTARRLLDEGVRLLEASAGDVERQRLRVLTATRADDEGVLELPGVDSDDGGRALGAGTALRGSHAPDPPAKIPRRGDGRIPVERRHARSGTGRIAGG